MAIHDWKKPTQWAKKTVQKMGFASLEEELLAFLKGDWYEELLKLLNCDLDLLELLLQADGDKAP